MLVCATLLLRPLALGTGQVGPHLPSTAASRGGHLPGNQPLAKADSHRGSNQTPGWLEFDSECGAKMSMPGINSTEPNQKPQKKYFQVVVQNEFVKNTLSLVEICSAWGLQCPRGSAEPYHSHISPSLC